MTTCLAFSSSPELNTHIKYTGSERDIQEFNVTDEPYLTKVMDSPSDRIQEIVR